MARRDPYQFKWWALSLIDARPARDRKKGADSGSMALSTSSFPVIANINTGVYQLPSCRYVSKIKNPVPMDRLGQAIAAGCRTCKVCRPPATP